MNTLTPIYTSENCPKPAFQLNWAISFFAHAPLPDADHWAQPLRETVEKEDDIRILEYRLPSPDVVQFLASTQPPAAPSFVLQRFKGHCSISCASVCRKRFDAIIGWRAWVRPNAK